MSMCISTAQARTRWAPRGCPSPGLRRFHCKFSHKRPLLRCACEFRLRRLAQSVGRGLPPRAHFSWQAQNFVDLDKKWLEPITLSWFWPVTSQCEVWHRSRNLLGTLCLSDWCAGMKALLGCSWKVLVARSCKILCSSRALFWRSWDSLRGPGRKILVKVSHNSLWEDLVEMLVKSRKRSLQCMLLYRTLWEDLEEVPVKSSRRPRMISYRSLWEDLEEVPVKSSRRPRMISYRSLWEDLMEILSKSSSRGPYICILKMLCVGVCVTFLLGCS